MSIEEQHTVETADGVKLQAWLASPARPIATLVLCHGLTTDSHEHGAFPALRDRALRSGLAVIRFDFRAHGRSGGTNEDLRLASIREDIDAVVALLDTQLGPDLPIIPLGLSFGGAPAVHAASTGHACAGLALWYAVVNYEWNYGVHSRVPFTGQMRAAKRDDDPAWSAMPILGTDYHLPVGLINELQDDRTHATLCDLSVPVLAYHGGRDSFVDVEPLRRSAAQRSNIDLRVVPGAGHGFLLWRPWVIRRTVWWAANVARIRRDGG